MNFKRITLLSTLLLVACAPPQKSPPVEVKTSKTIFDEIHRPFQNLMPKRVVGIKVSDTCPKYIKVWVGSYRDNRGNFIPGGWIWLRVRDCAPETNF